MRHSIIGWVVPNLLIKFLQNIWNHQLGEPVSRHQNTRSHLQNSLKSRTFPLLLVRSVQAAGLTVWTSLWRTLILCCSGVFRNIVHVLNKHEVSLVFKITQFGRSLCCFGVTATMMEEASTLETTVMFLTVSPHETTLHIDWHQNYKCGGEVQKTL